MYLYLGGDTVVKKESIVGIFDLDNTSQSHVTRAYLAAAEKAGQIINAADDIPKSFVVCAEEKGQRVYLSLLNSATLLGRSRGLGIE